MERAKQIIQELVKEIDLKKYKSKLEEVLSLMNENDTCVNCDEEKETYSICFDCLTKIINENKGL